MRSKFSSSINGRKMGSTITTMGTHSSGQPRMKITTSRKIRNSVGEKLNVSSDSAMNWGVPRRENTAPKKFDAATRKRIMHEVWPVRYTASVMIRRLNCP